MALTLYSKYNRREVHDLFDQASTFTPGAGMWGVWRIVPLKSNHGDYVLFVTFGRSQGGHTFQEEVFDDGTFTWQSQPRNKLTSKYVQDFIKHDSF